MTTRRSSPGSAWLEVMRSLSPCSFHSRSSITPTDRPRDPGLPASSSPTTSAGQARFSHGLKSIHLTERLGLIAQRPAGADDPVIRADAAVAAVERAHVALEACLYSIQPPDHDSADWPHALRELRAARSVRRGGRDGHLDASTPAAASWPSTRRRLSPPPASPGPGVAEIAERPALPSWRAGSPPTRSLTASSAASPALPGPPRRHPGPPCAASVRAAGAPTAAATAAIG